MRISPQVPLCLCKDPHWQSLQYSVKSFTHDLLNFIKKPENRELINKNKKINWRKKIYSLDAATIISLLHNIMVMERFSGGFLSAELKSGAILKLLERLKEIDESQN